MIISWTYFEFDFLIEKLLIEIFDIINNIETKIHKIEGKYSTQNKLTSFTTNVLNAEVSDWTKIAVVMAIIIVFK